MTSHINDLTNFLKRHERILVLTGAGVSTGSGIPDYRGVDGAWKRREPIRYQEFVGSQYARQRYWARSFAGWPLIAGARPNAAHRQIESLTAAGYLNGLITQNVDGLHQAAGSLAVDLHGSLSQVRCLDCGDFSDRSELQARLQALNAGWQVMDVDQAAPDGDADLDGVPYEDFKLAGCGQCGGMLKPDVVFFGEAVPVERVAQCMDMLQKSDAMLVLGSSLMVFSGFRFARAAHQAGQPVAAINAGKTRADDLLSLKVERDVGETLTQLAGALLDLPLEERA